MAENSKAMDQHAVRDTATADRVNKSEITQDHVPPGHKQNEVGIIPEGWVIRKVGDLAEIRRGASPRPISNPKWFDGKSDIGWLRISDVAREGKYIRTTGQSLSASGVSRSRLVRPGNVIMSMAATVGRPAINHKTVCIHDGFVVFNKLSLSTEFFYYLLLSIEGEWAERGQTGSQINLNTYLIGSTFVPLPKSDYEQRAIANVLSDVDALIDSLDRLIAKKRNIKQATMQELLTGRKRLPGFEGEWELKRLGDIANFFKGVSLTKSDLKKDGQKRCIHYGELFTRYGERIDFVHSTTDHRGPHFASTSNDVLMPTSDVTPNGLATASCIIFDDVVIGSDILVIRTPKDQINGEFLAYTVKVNRNQIMQLVTGTTVFHLYGRDMANFYFKMPNIDEQTAIADVLSDMDAEIEALERRREKTKQIKQGMMQELLTGRTRLVDPNSLDAEEEA